MSQESGGNCTHQVEVVDSETEPGKKVVLLVNDNDEFYVEYFRTREEANAIIRKLQAAADEAFGPASTKVEA